MPKVVNSPNQYPVMITVRHREIFAVKDEGIGELITVVKGELIVIRQSF